MMNLLPLNKSKTAFSLVELSIVIVIIGVLLIGVIGSKHLIRKARISSAQAITRSSVINGIEDNKLWLETSLDELAFGDTYTTGDYLTGWSDLSSNKTAINISVVGDNGPTYSNSINSVQAVKFDSSSATDHLQIDNAAFLNGTDYTIFITEKRIATNSGDGNYLLGSDGAFAVGYESGSTIIQTHGEAADDDNQASIESVADYANKPRTLTFTHSSTDGNKIYINGTLANEDSSTEAQTHLSGITTLAIGNNYNGEIGEIVIFDRDLKTTERRDVEDYMMDKWDSPNNRDVTASCTTGTVTSTGCDAACSVTINGSSDTSLSSGSSTNFTCDGTGYTSGSTTLEYTCSNGTLSPTPATSQCIDDLGCASGYTEVSNACLQSCTLSSGDSGLPEDVLITSGSSSYDCSSYGDSSYTGTIAFSSACNDGSSLTVSSGSCSVAELTCSGGTEIDISGYRIHTFNSSGTLACSDGDVNADILVVGAGGAGGSGTYSTTIGTGGGGGGGVIYATSLSLSAATYTVTVGGTTSGTVGSCANGAGSDGDPSIFSGSSITITAAGGGGGGGCGPGTIANGNDGGSGGGSHWDRVASSSSGNSHSGTTGATVTVYGNGGGASTNESVDNGGGGGGGGATEAGATGTSIGGDGGEGVSISITGSSVVYGSGGGGNGVTGGTGGTNAGSGTTGISTSRTGLDAADNKGGGGGGNVTSAGNVESGRGGSGIVIIRY